MKTISKKGQVGLGGMTSAILGIGVTIIALVMSLIIVQEMRDNDIVAIDSQTSITNETLASVTETGVAIAGNAALNCQLSVTDITRQNTSQIINPANYSVSGCTVSFVATGSIEFNNTNWNVTGTYTQAGEAYEAGNESLVGLATFGDFVSIIVLALVAGIVLGIIFGVFGGLGGKGRR